MFVLVYCCLLGQVLSVFSETSITMQNNILPIKQRANKCRAGGRYQNFNCQQKDEHCYITDNQYNLSSAGLTYS